MKNNWFCERNRAMRLSSIMYLLVSSLFFAGGAPEAAAAAPDWLRSLARVSLPSYPGEPKAVILFSEQITTVSDSGEVTTQYRQAFKILRPEGRDQGLVAVHYDGETRLTFLKAWSIPPSGQDYEVKEKDAVETSLFSEALYQDTRSKILRIPAPDPGNIIGYEFEQKRRSMILQDRWSFQREIPVRRARFVLKLPAGWEFDAIWSNYHGQEAQPIGQNKWMWELKNIPAIEPEPSMPAWRALEGQLAIKYHSRQESGGKSH